MIISVLSSLAAIGVPTFAKHIRTTKVSEVPQTMNLLRYRTLAYLRQPSTSRCFPRSAGPAPAHVATDAKDVDFYAHATPGSETWRALQFQPSYPIRYRYSWITSATSCDNTVADSSLPSTVIYRAEGDLDHDGEFSLFERTDEVSSGDLKSTGPVMVRNKLE